jgi:hypothetical protein
MISPIDRYLDELEKLLKKRVSKEDLVKMVDEIHAHLLMASRELAAAGLSVEEAEAIAVQQFGNSGLVAADLIRQHTGVNTKSAWKLVKWPMVLLAVSIIMCLGNFSPGVWSYVYLISRVFQAASLIAFVVIVVRSRRWLLTPMVAALLVVSASGACLLALTSARTTTAGNSRASQLAIVDQMQHIRDEQNYASRAYLAAESGQPLPNGAAYKANMGLAANKVPLVPTFNRQTSVYLVWGAAMPLSSSDNVTLDPVESGVDATAVWKRDGARALAGLNHLASQYDQFSREMNSKESMATFTSVRFSRQIVSAETVALVNASVLALLNGLFLWLAALSDQLRRKRTVRSSS